MGAEANGDAAVTEQAPQARPALVVVVNPGEGAAARIVLDGGDGEQGRVFHAERPAPDGALATDTAPAVRQPLGVQLAEPFAADRHPVRLDVQSAAGDPKPQLFERGGTAGLAELPDLGTERFLLRRKLGAGGFGAVFEALDQERNAVVALKILERSDPRALYGFKREFRSLAEIVHPNLVQLYELQGAGDTWFFTMELVAGRDVLTDLRPMLSNVPDAAETSGLMTQTEVAPLMPASPSEMDLVGAAPKVRVATLAAAPADVPRVRAIFHQVALGLKFLHDAGHLHRDIKPSNVMVTAAGRAVILDFGLVMDLVADAEQSSVDTIAGTPIYMAPEQALGRRVGPEADWYAMGVMLYEVLTGRPPFVGSVHAVLRAKVSEEPPPPEQFVDGVPEDLCELCRKLLVRDPAGRPTATEILARLGPGSSATNSPELPESELIGRDKQLTALREAFVASKDGHAVVALVHGLSGMGKSALCRRFRDELNTTHPGAVVLAGRCFQQESVPYKAFDGVVDALSQYLQRIAAAETEASMPRDVATLARLFPVLLQVRAVRDAQEFSATNDKQELRRRAFATLRELLGRIAVRHPLVLFIDDLQWGDTDSNALLAELLRLPDPPSLLLVASYRSEDTERGGCLAEVLSSVHKAATNGLDVREVAVERLTNDEAQALALAELQDHGEQATARAALIARDSGGWPFFIRELSRFSGAIATAAMPSLDEMLRARVAALSDDARRLIEVLAIAGQPLDRSAAAEAAALAGSDMACVDGLRKQRLLRVRGGSGREQIETYHDRIRETVASGLAAGTQMAHHGRLAQVLEARGTADAETLAIHFDAAGKPEKAGFYAEEAGDRDMQVLGFDRAARLYRRALELVSAQDKRRSALHAKLANALQDAGRGNEAAAAFLSAAEGQEPAKALSLRRSAAENQLISGHSDEGMKILREVLGANGITMPATNLGAILLLLPLLLLLKLRGLGFRERPASALSPKELLRLEACTATGGSLFHASLPSIYAQHLFLWYALRAGEPRWILYALVCVLTVQALLAQPVPSRTEVEQQRLALALAERFPQYRPLVDAIIGTGYVLRLHMQEGRSRLDKAEAALLEFRKDAPTEPGLPTINVHLIMSLSRISLAVALLSNGEWSEMARRTSAWIEDARLRGNIEVERMLLAHCTWVLALCADRPAESHNVIARAHALYPDEFQFKAYFLLVPRCSTAHYEDHGVGFRALRVITEHWPAIERSGVLRLNDLLRGQAVRQVIGAHIAAAAASTGQAREDLLNLAEQRIRWLERRLLSHLIWQLWPSMAAIAVMRGERERAATLLARTEEACFESSAILRVFLRRRRGELRGGAEGQALIDEADALLRAQGVVDPARMTSCYIPGAF